MQHDGAGLHYRLAISTCWQLMFVSSLHVTARAPILSTRVCALEHLRTHTITILSIHKHIGKCMDWRSHDYQAIPMCATCPGAHTEVMLLILRHAG